LTLLPPSDLIDTLNTKLLSPLISIQQFLPLLQRHSTPACPSSIILAYPSIPSSLSPPNQLPEVLTARSLNSLALSLRRELTTSSPYTTVHELKLGNFDLASTAQSTKSALNHNRSAYGCSPPRGTTGATQRLDPSQSQLVHTPHAWHSTQRAAQTRSSLGQNPLIHIRAAPARELHNAVFDCLAPPQTFKVFGRWDWTVSKRGGTSFVGTGARVYWLVGRWVPDSAVSWGLRVKEHGIFSSPGRRGVWRDEEQARKSQQEDYARTRRGSSEHVTEPTFTEGASPWQSGVWEKV
jgi:hypothetical protein